MKNTPSKYRGISLILSLFWLSGLLVSAENKDTLSISLPRSIADRLFSENKFDSAKIFFDLVSDIAQRDSNIRGYIDARIGTAKCDIRIGHYRHALLNLQELSELHQQNRCSGCTHLTAIYPSLSYCYTVLDDFSAAVRYAEKGIAENIALFGPDDDRTATSYYALGNIEKTRGEYRSAMSALRSAISIQSHSNNGLNKPLANSLFVLGSIYDDVDAYDSALVFFTRSMSILDRLNLSASSDAALVHLYRMTSYGHLSRYDQAIDCGKKALAIFDSLGMSEHNNAASTYAKLAEMFLATGDYELTKRYLHHALDIFERRYPDKRSAIGGYSILLGEVYDRSGELDKAIPLMERGLKLYEAVYGPDHPQIGFRYETGARIYFDAKRYDNALKYYRKALVIREQTSNTADGIQRISLNTSIGNVFLVRHNYDSARHYLTAALALERSLGNRNTSLSAVLQKRCGDLALGLRQFDSAISCYFKAVSLLSGTEIREDIPVLHHDVFHTVTDKKELVEVVERIAKAYEEQYHGERTVELLERSQRMYLAAMDMIDDLRRQYSSDESKFFLAQHGSSIYRRGSSVSAQLYQRTGLQKFLEDAFLIADRNKGNVLLDRLADNSAKKNSMIPDSLLETERSLLNMIAYLESRLPRTGVESDIREGSSHRIQSDYFSVSRQHQTLLELIETKYPEYYRSKYAKVTLTIADARRVLEPNEVMLEYMMDDDGVSIFALSQRSLVLKRVKADKIFKSVVKDFSTSLKTFDVGAYWRSGSELYQRLLLPVAGEIRNADKLTIVPDGVLHSIPFEAIPVSRKDAHSTDFTTAEFLINRFDVSYAYSAAFRALVPAAPVHEPSPELTFAGFAPVFKDSSKGNDLFANRSFAEQSGVSDVRSITLDGRKFNELKYSEDEVVSIGRRMKEHSVVSSTFLFSSATEHNFKMNAPNADIIHVATHGFINESDPKLSAVIFSQPEHADSNDDGILYVNEAANLQLTAKLVVLSSCESGVGQLVNGEGMIALSRGLLYAGAQNVVFSLWKVSDKQTYRLMDEFYAGIAQGKDFSSSLRSAKLSMLRSKESAFPGKWSGFVLIGR